MPKTTTTKATKAEQTKIAKDLLEGIRDGIKRAKWTEREANLYAMGLIHGAEIARGHSLGHARKILGFETV